MGSTREKTKKNYLFSYVILLTFLKGAMSSLSLSLTLETLVVCRGGGSGEIGFLKKVIREDGNKEYRERVREKEMVYSRSVGHVIRREWASWTRWTNWS